MILYHAIPRETFWALAKFRHLTHQVCFHTAASLVCIKFMKAEVLSHEDNLRN